MGTHVNFKCGCSSWLIRCLTWATIASAFVLSIISLQSCELLEVNVLYFEKHASDITAQDYANAGVEFTSAPREPWDPYFDPRREQPAVVDTRYTTLGALKGGTYQCLHYTNNYSMTFMEAGVAEALSAGFGALATLLGGLSMLIFFGLVACSNPQSRFLGRCAMMSFGAGLIMAAFCQLGIFALLASEHCQDQFWADYLSAREDNLETEVVSTCEIGSAGWLAIIAFLLYLLASGMACNKFFNPEFGVVDMEWTKGLNDDNNEEEKEHLNTTGSNNDEESGEPTKSDTQHYSPEE